MSPPIFNICKRITRNIPFIKLDAGVSRDHFTPGAFVRFERKVLPGARAIVWSSIVFLAALSAWASFTSFDQVVTAEGKLRPASHVQVVNHPRGGKVSRLMVKGGDHVRAGQELLEFDAVSLSEELKKLEAQCILLAAELTRLEAERDGAESLDFNVDMTGSSDVAQSQLALFNQRMANQQKERESLLSGLKEKQGLLRQQLAKLEHSRRSLELATRQERAVTELAAKGYFAKIRAMQVQRDVAAVRSDVAQTEALVSATTAAVSAAEAKLAQFESNRAADIIEQITVKRSALEVASSSKAQIEDQLKNLTLVSPVSGYVEQLKVHTIGEAIGPGEEMMRVIPDDGEYVIDVRVRNKDIGVVRVGQGASVKIRAFDYVKYGTMPGVVISVASDSYRDDLTGEEAFLVQVKTAERGEYSNIKVHAGMLGEVDFHVGTRTPLGYLYDAVVRASDRALSE